MVTESVFRRATAGDAPEIAAIHVASWRSAYVDIIDPAHLAQLSVEQREQTWRRIIPSTADDTVVLVAEVDGDVRGFACAGPSRDADATAHTGELRALYLHPDQARHGIGTGLQHAALAGLTQSGFRTASLWVLDRNAPARRFYETTGWELDLAQEWTEIGDRRHLERRYRRTLDRV